MGGQSTDNYYEKYKNYRNVAIEQLDIPGITLVRSKQQAQQCIKILKTLKDRVHAWDTETIDLDIKTEAPVGNGKIICASAFCGVDVDFGNGPRLVIDNFAQNTGLIMQFKDYLENEQYLKVWHNIGFDRHVFYNHGIDVQGFGGDTLHMMRLLNPSRGPGEYSLAKITTDFEQDIMLCKKFQNQQQGVQKFQAHFLNANIKTTMKQLFAQQKSLKSGQVGKTIEFPNIIKMHSDKDLIEKWINYSSLDAEVTFFVYEILKRQLQQREIDFENMKNLYDLYNKYWKPFGYLLTDMEREGFQVDKEHLEKAKVNAEEDIKRLQNKFLQWAYSTQSGLEMLNSSSNDQLQQLFFAPYQRQATQKKNNNNNNKEETGNEQSDIDEDSGYHSDGRKVGIRKVVNDFPLVKSFKVLNEKGIILEGKNKPLKNIDMNIKGLGWPIEEYTASGLPSVDTPTLKKMTGNPDKGKYGSVYEWYKKKDQEEEGIKASQALQALLELRTVETLKQTFIIPLIECLDKNNRIHCSININTETGRLSCRKPNLQNQPAMGKDIYKIRQAFIPGKGKKLIVADYGQVELRILAHITNCTNMIKAFKEGGDFHSRTAIGMYDYIRNEIDKGELLLEWDKSQGEAPAPLVKDKYGDERKKAKTMNFSIAYGKSAHGFAKDWDCTIEEAQQQLDLWYSDRKEVKEWQSSIKKTATEKGWSQTLMGRYRDLTKLVHKGAGNRNIQHGLRASINTPIQGGAADIVIACMVKVHQNKRLKELGWKLLLQIHDEIILEGPEESAQEALQIVIQEMENPIDTQLKIKLEVDAKIGDSWYECK